MEPTSLRLMLVDDEPLARLRLRSQLQGLAGGPGAAAGTTAASEVPAGTTAAPATPATAPRADVVAEAANADEALRALRCTEVDAVLLDIGLPGPSGLRLADALKSMASPPAVVFVTAHAEHALEAFDLDAVDYLTKPVRAERLAAALARVALRRGRVAASPPAGVAPGDATAATGSGDAAGGALLVPTRGRVLHVPHREIVYLKAEQKLVQVRTADASHWVDDSLFDLEQRLGAGFIRVHRNALVAVAAIRRLELRELRDPREAGGADEPADGRARAAGRAAEDAISEGWAVLVAPVNEWLAVSRRQVAAVRAALQALA